MPLLNEADAIFLGDTQVDAVYLGDVKVWPSSVPHYDAVPTGSGTFLHLTGPTPMKPGPATITLTDPNGVTSAWTDDLSLKIDPTQATELGYSMGVTTDGDASMWGYQKNMLGVEQGVTIKEQHVGQYAMGIVDFGAAIQFRFSAPVHLANTGPGPHVEDFRGQPVMYWAAEGRDQVKTMKTGDTLVLHTVDGQTVSLVAAGHWSTGFGGFIYVDHLLTAPLDVVGIDITRAATNP